MNWAILSKKICTFQTVIFFYTFYCNRPNIDNQKYDKRARISNKKFCRFLPYSYTYNTLKITMEIIDNSF